MILWVILFVHYILGNVVLWLENGWSFLLYEVDYASGACITSLKGLDFPVGRICSPKQYADGFHWEETRCYVSATRRIVIKTLNDEDSLFYYSCFLLVHHFPPFYFSIFIYIFRWFLFFFFFVTSLTAFCLFVCFLFFFSFLFCFLYFSLLLSSLLLLLLMKD